MDPVNPQGTAPTSRVDQLGQELEDLKQSVLAQQQPAAAGPVPTPDPAPVSSQPVPVSTPTVPLPVEDRKRNPIITLGVVLLFIALGALLFTIVKSLVQKTKLPTLLKTKATPTPESTPAPTPDTYGDWQSYEGGEGLYSFRFPSDFTRVAYNESTNQGVMVSLGETVIKTVLIPQPGKAAQSYAQDMRSQAMKLSGSSVTATQVETLSVGNSSGYGYDLKGLGVARDLYIPVGEALVRIQIAYNQEAEVTVIDKILASFEFGGTSKGGEPASGFGY